MSVTNFEDITEDLTEAETRFTDEMKFYLETILSEGVVKQADIVEIINMKIVMEHGTGHEIKLTPMRLRKYFNFFRTNGIIPIIATSNGCYISKDQNEIAKQILSMEERARQILRASEGMKKFLI